MLRIVDEVSVCREGGGVLVEMGLARCGERELQ